MMTPDSFSYCLKNPKNIGASDTKLLREVVDQFPYFQTARALYLKGLKNTGSFRYTQALKATAIQTTDRRQLFDLIYQNQSQTKAEPNSKNLNLIKEIEIIGMEDISVEKSIAVDHALRLKIKEGTSMFHFQLEGQSIDKPSDESELPQNEKRSFSSWLKTTDFKPIDRSNNLGNTQTKNFEIISNFIALNPKLKPIDSDISTSENIGDGAAMQTTWMTETLAKIYTEQKNYEKAIRSYRILSLKYPEKSAYFARQIKSLTALKAQNKI